MFHVEHRVLLLSAFLHALWNAELKQEEDTAAAAVAVLAIAAATAAALVPLSRGPAFSGQGAVAWAGLFALCIAAYLDGARWARTRPPAACARDRSPSSAPR
jgi:peptidoglycan/LPS O-acetylase OafA/YrhL